MRYVVLFVLLVTALLAACAPVGIPTTQSFGQSPLDTSPLPTAAASGKTNTVGEGNEAENAVIIYERDGGFAGIHDVWRIYADGRVMAEATQAQLPDSAVSDSMQRIVDGGFFALSDEYMPADRCCDRFTYKLTVVHNGMSKTVTTMDGAEQPPALTEALAVVGSLIQQATPAQ